jgi:hypothetical protein
MVGDGFVAVVPIIWRDVDMKREIVIPLIASLGINWMIHRSFVKLSGTFRRLLLGLCIANILSSLAQTLSTISSP